MKKLYLFFNVSILLLCHQIIIAQINQNQRKPLLDQFQKELIKINERIYVAVGYGASNSTMIIGNDSLIIVDCMLGTEAAEDVLSAFRTISNLPIGTIIYTHNHTDHVGGASVFTAETNPTIIACSNSTANLKGYEKLDDILYYRSVRQFGSFLSTEEKIAGIAPVIRPMGGRGDGKVKPNKLFDIELTTTISGVKLELANVPGETDNHLYIWLPDDKVLFCGDNFYFSFPNIYAIRGTKYRDINQWINSLSELLNFDADVLVSGHAKPIAGQKNIKSTLRNYRAALSYVLEETLNGMNKGLNPVDISVQLQLPDSLNKIDYLNEFYGVIPWAVRNIYNGYLGWFDGNPTNLFPMHTKEEAVKIIKLAGGVDSIIESFNEAMRNEEYQWACQLIDYLLAIEPENKEYRKMKSSTLFKLADLQTSSNARHYYLTVAKELIGEVQLE